MSRKKSALKICERISKECPELEETTCLIGELLFARASASRLGIVFRQATVGTLDVVKWWMGANDPDKFLFDPQRPKETYRDMFGERRLSDCTRSVYISAYDAQNNKVITFFSRRKDLFSLAPETGSETSPGDHKLWDIVMASTANPFAFPPHKTEDGIVCVDKAVIHPPFAAVNDILEHKPADVDVKLVIVGTGKWLTKLPGDMLIEQYKNLGVLGNLMKGREIAELESYMSSMSRAVLNRTLGKDNVIEISPRLSPQSYTEAQEFPSTDVLDASEENVKKILRQARTLLVTEDDRIRDLAQMLVENLHTLGQMNEEKYKRVRARIGVKTAAPPLETGIGKEIPNIYQRVFGAPTLRQVFKKWAKGLVTRGGRADIDAPLALPPPKPEAPKVETPKVEAPQPPVAPPAPPAA
jgi:hypothetical protein